MKFLAVLFLVALAAAPGVHSNIALNLKPLNVAGSKAMPVAALRHLTSAVTLKPAAPRDTVIARYGRGLTQAASSFCLWDASNSECQLSNAGLIPLLESVSNPVADYVARILTCGFSQSEAACDAAKCEWFGTSTGCDVTHEEFREFHSVDCLAAVDHIIEASAGFQECAPKETEIECGAASRCTWSGESCSWDVWYHYYGIRSVAGFPEGFNEVYEERESKYLEDVGIAIDNGVLETIDDLFVWNPPAFTCPSGTEQVVCDYVEAFVPFMTAGLYCFNAYEADAAGCNADPSCQSDSTGDDLACIASAAVRDRVLVDAAIAFAEGIEDQNARDYQVQFFTCQSFFTVDSCEAEPNCAWLEAIDGCYVTGKWVAEDIASLVDESEGPVFSCGEEALCFYNDARESCGASIAAEVAHGLSVSDELDLLIDSIDACEAAGTATTCAAVTP